MSRRQALERETLDRCFGEIWPIHHHAFTALLIECARHFEGDLREMLVLSIIGDRTLEKGRTDGLTYDQFVSGRRSDDATRRINVQSIADCSGIPRETVRRKVERLVRRGWVERAADGTLVVAQQAAVDLAPATRATFDYFLAVGNALLHAVDRPRD